LIFKKGSKLGITLTLSIFFHEIPHEIGDFSFLLKQNIGKYNALSSQIFSAVGALIGVYLSNLIFSFFQHKYFLIGDEYSLQILAFASGLFLYLAINTMLGDIKQAKSLFGIISEIFAFILGYYFLFIIM